MASYKMITSITMMGSYVSKLILDFPYEVKKSDVSTESFNVYVERREAGTTDVVVSESFFTHEKIVRKGYQNAWKVYPCNEMGLPVLKSDKVAIELKEEDLGKRIEGTILTSRLVDHYYRVTMLHTVDDDPAKAGLVFDTCTEEIVPQLSGWKTVTSADVEKELSYAYYLAKTEKKAPVIIWLHGAGEGGLDPRTTIWCNGVSNLSSPAIQKFYGGAAHILTPQCPTVWMDDGVEKLGKSNQSIFVKRLKACIDNFISENEAIVDTNRIYVGGMSNGGFMTMRMLFDYPDFFAGAQPSCEVFYSSNISEEMLESIKNIPIWFAHCKKDELVPPRETAIPTYLRLKAAGAPNVHCTYYEELVDFTGRYKDDFGQPRKMFNHGVWNNVLENECHTEIDGTNVLVNGEPMTIWEWMANQSK